MQDGEFDVEGLVVEADAPAEDTTAESEDITAEESEVTEAEDGDDGENADVDAEMKTIKKALNKKNRYIDNLRARNRALESEMQKLQQEPEAKPAPNEAEFDSVMDYLKAQQKYDLEQHLAAHGNQQQLTALQQQQAMLAQEINVQNQQKYQEVAAANPDIKATMESPEIHAVVQSLPDHIDTLFNEVDNPALAGYVLAKEGRLADLAYMHPQVALVEIVNAMHRGAAYTAPKPKPVSKAPQPLAPNKGSVRHGKSPDNMSIDEIMEMVK